ncbi:YjbQ family protein [Microcoleus sp. AT9_B5]
MKIINQTIEILTELGIGIYNITPQIVEFLDSSAVKNGQLLVFSRHTTTALAINENEERLLTDIKVYLQKLAPTADKYLHKDLHLRIVPPDEPIDAHSHLMAMTETIQDTRHAIDRSRNKKPVSDDTCRTYLSRASQFFNLKSKI